MNNSIKIELSNTELIEKLASGDRKAFDYVYTCYVNDLFAYGKGFNLGDDELQDVLHDLFLYLLLNPTVFNGIINIKAFLIRCLKNRILDILKRPYNFTDINGCELPFSIQVDILEELIDQENAANIQKQIELLLNSLTPRQREAIYLRYMQNLSFEEIAVILNLTHKGSRKLVARAMDSMRKNNHLLFLILTFYVLKYYYPMCNSVN